MVRYGSNIFAKRSLIQNMLAINNPIKDAKEKLKMVHMM